MGRCNDCQTDSTLAPLTDAQCHHLVLQQAAVMLDSGAPPAGFVGREVESQHLYNLLSRAVLEAGVPLIRVYGPPGTGKTYTVMRQVAVLAEDPAMRSSLSHWWSPRDCSINGAMLHQSKDALKTLLAKTLPSPVNCEAVFHMYKTSGISMALEAFIKIREQSKCGRTVVVLDEADQLLDTAARITRRRDGTSCDVVHKFIEAALQCGVICVRTSQTSLLMSAACALVVISNSLPSNRRLRKGLLTTAPADLVVFEAYSEADLLKILDRRIELAKENVLRQLRCNGRLTPRAKKVIDAYAPFADSAKKLTLRRLAAHQGDCRQMLETCRYLLLQKVAEMTRTMGSSSTILHTSDTLCSEMAPLDTRSESESTAPSSPRTSGSNNSANSASLLHDVLQTEDSSTTSTVKFEDAVKVLDRQFQKSKSRCTELLSNLPLHQQILLCAICIVSHEASSRKESARTGSFAATESDDSYGRTTLEPVGEKTIQAGYKKLCIAHKIPLEYNSMNFTEALSNLQTTGVIDIDRSIRLTRPVRGAIRGRRGVRPSFSRVVGTQHSQHIWHDTSAGLVELLLDPADACEVLRQSKQMFGTWLDSYGV